MIDTNCFIPVYTMDSKETAINCGKSVGILYSVILTFFLILIIISVYFAQSKKHKEDPVNNKKPNLPLLILISVIALILIWLIPVGMVYSNTISWNQNQKMIDNYMKQGMTRAEAVSRISTLREAQAQREATLEAGREQANATNNLAAALLANKKKN